jgi:hypothetical protein
MVVGDLQNPPHCGCLVLTSKVRPGPRLRPLSKDNQMKKKKKKGGGNIPYTRSHFGIGTTFS